MPTPIRTLRSVPTVLTVLPALLAAALLGAAMLLAPAPAFAHDTLISSDPADGATVATSPEQITLTYSANVLEVSPVVQISDPAGANPIELVPVVDGPTVTAEITEPLPAGEHTVQWRVVSSDGHPIEGTITFTVQEDTPTGDGAAGTDGADGAASDGGGVEEGAGAGTAPSDGGTESAPSDGSEGDIDEPDPATETSSTLPLLLGVVGVAVLGVLLAAYFARRRR